MNKDLTVPPPPVVESKKDKSKGPAGLNPLDTERRENEGIKPQPNPDAAAHSKNQAPAVTSSPQESRAKWGALDAEMGVPVPDHYMFLRSRWHTYTVQQQQDFAGDEGSFFRAADAIKAKHDKVRVKEVKQNEEAQPVNASMKDDSAVRPSPPPESTKHESKHPSGVDPRATVSQEADNERAQPVHANMTNEDSLVPSPTTVESTKDESKGPAGLNPLDTERRENEGIKSQPNPDAAAHSKDQAPAVTSSPQESRAKWGASDAETGVPVPDHYMFLRSRWHTYTVQQQQDFAGDEENILNVANDIKAKHDKKRDEFGRGMSHLESRQGGGPDSSTAKQVLVFGSSGTGKTSFVNALTEGNISTGGCARGVTLESNEVSVSREGSDYRVIDTVGLNEADKGGVSAADAMRALMQLLSRTEGGLNLMIMVVEKGRIHESTLDNYKLFVDTLTSRAVPLLVVVTHCEREDGDMQGWVTANHKDFWSRGIQAKGFLATTFVTPDPEFDNVEAMDRKVRESVNLSWRAIRSLATPDRVDFMKLNGGFDNMARKTANSVASHIGVGALWTSNYLNLTLRGGREDRPCGRRGAYQTEVPEFGE